MKRVYLDHAASTPLDSEVLEAMMPYLTQEFGNPSSVHGFGQRARGAIDEARARVASLIGARDSEIVFTGSGTEADNLAIGGVLRAVAADPEADRADLVTSSIEHHAVLNSAKGLDRTRHRVTFARVDETGRLDLSDLAAPVNEKTALVSVMFANNETGVLHPIDEVIRLARAKGALVHTDAVQAVGKVPIDTRRLDVDLLTLSAHKIHGPKGVGALFVRGGTKMAAIIRGGSQERNRRAGTENVAGIVGLGRAAEIALSRLAGDAARIARLRDQLEAKLVAAGRGAVVVNGTEPRICMTTNVSFEGVSGEDLLIALDLAGVAVSTGAACAAGSPEPSHVLKAMGFPRERVNSAIRFSLGRDTTEEEIDRTVEAVTTAVEQLRRGGGRPATRRPEAGD